MQFANPSKTNRPNANACSACQAQSLRPQQVTGTSFQDRSRRNGTETSHKGSAKSHMRFPLTKVLIFSILLLCETSKAQDTTASAGKSVEVKPFIVVSGDFQTGGLIPFTSQLTLLGAMTAAGGYHDTAEHIHVYLIRGGKAVRYNLKDIRKDPSQDALLRHFDVLSG